MSTSDLNSLYYQFPVFTSFFRHRKSGHRDHKQCW